MTAFKTLLQLISEQLQIDGELMNKITQLFLSTLVFSGFAYGMDQQMSREEFSNKFNQFKNFSLTPTNKDEFGTLYKDLMNHIDQSQAPIYRSFKGMINGIRTEKMQVLPQEFINYPGVNRPRNQLDGVKKKLFANPGQEFALVLPNQYVLDAELGIVKNKNNEN